jgi:hypothetical protein
MFRIALLISHSMFGKRDTPGLETTAILSTASLANGAWSAQRAICRSTMRMRGTVRLPRSGCLTRLASTATGNDWAICNGKSLALDCNRP